MVKAFRFPNHDRNYTRDWNSFSTQGLFSEFSQNHMKTPLTTATCAFFCVRNLEL